MSSGPKIQRAQRRRREVALTLSDDARARLEELAEERQESRSAVVEELILSIHERIDDAAQRAIAHVRAVDAALAKHEQSELARFAAAIAAEESAPVDGEPQAGAGDEAAEAAGPRGFCASMPS
jgi:predicted transcriptional regulator